jgi:hypothetical protein
VWAGCFWKNSIPLEELERFSKIFEPPSKEEGLNLEWYNHCMDEVALKEVALYIENAEEDAEIDLKQARYFVEEVKAWLQREKWLGNR